MKYNRERHNEPNEKCLVLYYLYIVIQILHMSAIIRSVEMTNEVRYYNVIRITRQHQKQKVHIAIDIAIEGGGDTGTF